MAHRTRIITHNGGHSFTATCSCKWLGQVTADRAAAASQAGDHEVAELRKEAGPKPK